MDRTCPGQSISCMGPIFCSRRSWANRSCLLYKRVTMSKSILSFFTKKWPWANRSQISFKKSDVSDSLVIWVNSSQKTSNLLEKKTYFSYDFDSYSPFLCQKSKSLPSLFAQSLFFKDWWDRFAYGHSFVKNDGSDSRANRSLDHKNERFARKTDDPIPNLAES